MKLFLTSLTLLMCSLHGKSQEIDHQFWVNYTLTIPVSSNFSYGGDVGFRGFISNKDWNQFLIRPTATYRFNQTVGVAGAVAMFNTFNNDFENLHEFRIHQDLTVRWPDLSVVSFFYRLRIEERFFFLEGLPNSSNVRIRTLIGIESQDLTFFGSKRPIYLQAIWEGFKTFGDDNMYEVFINQVRIHFAFGHRISNKFRYELHYISQRSGESSNTLSETKQHIYRIRFFHRIAKE